MSYENHRETVAKIVIGPVYADGLKFDQEIYCSDIENHLPFCVKVCGKRTQDSDDSGFVGVEVTQVLVDEIRVKFDKAICQRNFVENEKLNLTVEFSHLAMSMASIEVNKRVFPSMIDEDGE